jgi:NAD(P)-dependent dehydrogenase (short-subunit alcohol dehydrogenase family)
MSVHVVIGAKGGTGAQIACRLLEQPAEAVAAARVGLRRIVALYCRSSTVHRNRYHIRCRYF